MRLALAGGAPDMPDLPDMMSGNLKCMTIQGRRPGPPTSPHLPRMEAAGRAGSPQEPPPRESARRGVSLPMPPTGRIRPMPFHPPRTMPCEVGRARHARHAPDIEKAMSGGEKR